MELIEVYQRFVRERHRVHERRRGGAPAPWSQDEIVARKKFTNVFRVLDYGSQFAVGILNEPGLSRQEAFARAFLYRYTNLPSAWDAVRDVLGRYPVLQDMADGTLFMLAQSDRRFGALEQAWRNAIEGPPRALGSD